MKLQLYAGIIRVEGKKTGKFINMITKNNDGKRKVNQFCNQ